MRLYLAIWWTFKYLWKGHAEIGDKLKFTDYLQTGFNHIYNFLALNMLVVLSGDDFDSGFIPFYDLFSKYGKTID